MKKWSIYIIILFLIGCTDETPVPVPPTIEPENNDVTIRVKFPYADSPNTYAIDTKKENKIDRLDILAFTKGSTNNLLDDEFKYTVQATITDDGANSNGREQKATATLKTLEDKQRLVVIANLPSEIDLSTITEGTKMINVVERLRFKGNNWYPVGGLSNDKTSFPMWGQDSTFYKIHHTGVKPSTIDIQMIRSVAKIEVGVDVYGSGDPALGFGSIFKIHNIYVCNASDSGYIAPHNDYLTGGSVYTNDEDTIIKKVRILASNGRIDELKYMFPQDERSLLNTIYLPESDTLKSGNKPAFLVVQATYLDHSDPTNSSQYYRVDFSNKGKYVPILRNHNYLINITNIRSNGYNTLQEAKNAPESVLASLEIDEEQSYPQIPEVTYATDGGYYLAYSGKRIYIDWYRQNDTNGNEVKIYVKTSHTGGWKVSNPIGFAGFVGRTQNETSNPTTLDSIRFNVSENVSGQPKEFKFTITSGAISEEITIIQSAGSNSYIVTGNSVKIPTLSANAGGVSRIIAGQSLKATGVLWAESTIGNNVQANHNSTDDIIEVTGISGKGNLLIYAVTNSCQLYTWHLWVTDKDPTITQYYNNGFIFMARNLGSPVDTDGGLYYQWGRKDPFTLKTKNSYYDILMGPGGPGGCSFGGGGMVGGTYLPEGNFLEDAVLLPTHFLMSETAPFDWAASAVVYQNNNYWNTINGEKGPYDPCPFGWRVPVDDAWMGFSGNSKNGIVLPTAGYLDMVTGSHVNNGFSVWGATAKGTSAYLFNGSDSQSFRANGYPVRCVRDSR